MRDLQKVEDDEDIYAAAIKNLTRFRDDAEKKSGRVIVYPRVPRFVPQSMYKYGCEEAQKYAIQNFRHAFTEVVEDDDEALLSEDDLSLLSSQEADEFLKRFFFPELEDESDDALIATTEEEENFKALKDVVRELS